MNKTQKIIILIVSVVLAAVISACIFVSEKQKNTLAEFVPPSFDNAFIEGVPVDVPDSAVYKTLNIRQGYTIGTATRINIEKEKGVFYFTNFADNDFYIKLVLYNEKNEFVGESGLIKPGGYLRNVKLDTGKISKEINIKILTYEKNTFYSCGTASVKVSVFK